MARQAFIETTGGPEVIGWRDVALPLPGPGEVRMRNTAIGLNYIDTYHRSGLYPTALPSGLGLEAAGVIDAVGDGVDSVLLGDRVCTFGPALGAYSDERNIAASSLLAIPDDISDEIAAAALLKACTVEALVERCAKVQAKWPVLVHAAAGGVGLLLVQWLKHMGAVVIGTASSEDKLERVRAAGADHALLSGSADLAEQVIALSEGGVRVSFDGVGKDSWETSLKATAPRGLIVSFGNASGPVEGVNLGTLSANGSLFVTRPTLFHYYADPGERQAGVEYVFEMIRTGAISVSVDQRYALADAAQAHRDLEARKTTGSTVLIP
jgi:NADPH:quinone reductase